MRIKIVRPGQPEPGLPASCQLISRSRQCAEPVRSLPIGSTEQGHLSTSVTGSADADRSPVTPLQSHLWRLRCGDCVANNRINSRDYNRQICLCKNRGGEIEIILVGYFGGPSHAAAAICCHCSLTCNLDFKFLSPYFRRHSGHSGAFAAAALGATCPQHNPVF